MTALQSWLLVLGCALLVFVVARLLGDVLAWWARLTREEGDIDDGR